MTSLSFAEPTLTMSETPLGSYQTLNHTEKEWIGHVINRAATLVPRSEDRILIRYGFTRGRATRNEVLLGNTLQYFAFADTLKILADTSL